MITLNKNQRKFFEEAIKYFKEGSDDVRLKDISEFATENDLIVPTSALKQHCHDEDQVRGHYNLFLSGIEYEEVHEEVPVLKDFPSADSVILDAPAFVETSTKKQPKRFNPTGMQRLVFRNPVYLVINTNDTVISVRKLMEDAYKDRILSFHDQGTKSINEVREELEYKGCSRIPSNNSQLWCDIVVIELK